jgi:threonine synthase
MEWSYATHYVCDECASSFDLHQPLNTCPNCGGLLETQYDLERLRRHADRGRIAARPRSIWRWHEFLPVHDEDAVVSMGEGDTPLMPSAYAGPKLGLSRLYFKNDTLMPTGSFKDRGFSLALSFALRLGIRQGITYSSGNAGSSFAAYAARAGFRAAVLVEYTASPLKKAMIALYGADTVTLEFDSMTEITAMLEEAVRELGLYQFVNFINPIRHEAMKTYAYEICEALGWRAPDVMVHPVGTGGGIWGAWKGFRELGELGWIDRLPRMAAVQPAATAPIPRAFRQRAPRAERHGDPAATIAQSIAADAPIQGGKRVLRAIYESGGFAEEVTDEQIIEAMQWLGREGILAEPASASSLAAVMKAARLGVIGPDDCVVCVITGTGMKQPAVVQEAAPKSPWRIHAEIGELKQWLSKNEWTFAGR